MKKFLLIILLSCTPVFAEEAVFLELKPHETYEIKKHHNTQIKDMNINNKKDEDEYYMLHPMEYVKQEFKDMYFNKKSDE